MTDSRAPNSISRNDERVKTLATQLLAQKLESLQYNPSPSDIRYFAKEAVSDAHAAIIAVDEYLCG